MRDVVKVAVTLPDGRAPLRLEFIKREQRLGDVGSSLLDYRNTSVVFPI